jgi:hypothetical protein
MEVSYLFYQFDFFNQDARAPDLGFPFSLILFSIMAVYSASSARPELSL